jgi:DNA (cytosine-5)-methyltransferase 1
MKEQLNELALFAGAGGGILGGKLLGWRTICAVEWEPYPASVLVARQNDGILPAFPIWDDVQTFDGKPWRGLVDVVSGGFPCQDISAAGKGAGIEGERSSMWKHMARIIGEVRPQYAFVENSPMLVGRGLATVLADLAKMGYDAKWGIVGAHHVSAPHRRDRIWILAHTMRDGLQRSRQDGDSPRSLGLCGREKRDQKQSLCDATSEGFPLRVNGSLGQPRTITELERSDWWEVEPNVGRVVNELAGRVDRLKAIGNGQVPQAAALAWNTLKQ